VGPDPLEIAEDVLADLPDSIRAFVGIGIPDAQRGVLADYLEACRAVAPELRWVGAANLHLTLRFLGQSETARVARLAGSLRRLEIEPFAVRLGGVGSFGRGSAVRVAWIGVAAGSDELRRLAATVEAECVAAGFPPEERPYSPHLTLARARQRRGARVPDLPVPPTLEPWRVSGFRLYRSRPGPGGAVYTVLEEFGA
jgi:RNA 2',3'-cyclic 3'-phosphodiesterase